MLLAIVMEMSKPSTPDFVDAELDEEQDAEEAEQDAAAAADATAADAAAAGGQVRAGAGADRHPSHGEGASRRTLPCQRTLC